MLHLSREAQEGFTRLPSPSVPTPEMQGPACLYTWQEDGAQGQCAWQVHHTALGTQGRAQGWAQPSLRAPLLVSSVPVCSQKPKHLAEDGAVGRQGFLLPGEPVA